MLKKTGYEKLFSELWGILCPYKYKIDSLLKVHLINYTVIVLFVGFTYKS